MSTRLRSLVASGPASADDAWPVLQRVRWRFVLIVLIGASLAPFNLVQLEEGTGLGPAAYLAATALYVAWAVALYRTGGGRLLVHLLGPVAIVLIGVSAGHALWAFGPLYMAIFLHGLYGSRRRVLTHALLYFIAYVTIVVITEGAAAAVNQGMLAQAAALLIMSWVMSELGASLRHSDVVRRREEVLGAAGQRLLRAGTPDEVARATAAGAADLIATAAAPWRVSVARQDGEDVHLAAVVGAPLDMERAPLGALPGEPVSTYRANEPVRLDSALAAQAKEAAGVVEDARPMVVVPLSDGETPLGMIAVETDVELDDDTVTALERFAHEASLADRAARRAQLLTGVVENSADGIALIDADGRLAFVSPAVGELAGRSVHAAEALGDLLFRVEGDEARPVEDLEDLLGTQAVLGVRRPDGSLLEVEVSTRRVADEGTVLNIRNVSEKRRLQAEITYRAFYDSVTGLPNRALFLDRLDHALARARRAGTRLAVVLLDLDDFKGVNDRLGHLTGDLLLRHVADQIEHRIRESDTVARLGGDEFALLLEGMAPDQDARGHLDELLTVVRRPLTVDGHRVTVGVSAGLVISDGQDTAEDMIGAADLAMYAAKDAGKNVTVPFESALRTAAIEQRRLREDLETAIDDDELRVHYQPVIALDDERTVGVEALVRWQHPDLGTLSPATFVPLAERTGLVVPLGRRVLAIACRDLAAWRADGLVDDAFQLHVNLSARQLADVRLVEEVQRVLADNGLLPDQLVLEITETTLAEDPAVAQEALRRLHRLGVGVALDDFGTGYASFTYLREFPVDVVKIDRSFVSDITDGPESAALAQAIVRLAGSLGMTTVAEGVEKDGPRALLAEWGCERAQGWHWAPALPVDALATWLRDDATRARAALPVAAHADTRAS